MIQCPTNDDWCEQLLSSARQASHKMHTAADPKEYIVDTIQGGSTKLKPLNPSYYWKTQSTHNATMTAHMSLEDSYQHVGMQNNKNSEQNKILPRSWQHTMGTTLEATLHATIMATMEGPMPQST